MKTPVLEIGYHQISCWCRRPQVFPKQCRQLSLLLDAMRMRWHPSVRDNPWLGLQTQTNQTASASSIMASQRSTRKVPGRFLERISISSLKQLWTLYAIIPCSQARWDSWYNSRRLLKGVHHFILDLMLSSVTVNLVRAHGWGDLRP